MLFVALGIGIIFFVTFNTLQPLYEAEFTRNTATTIANNPQITPQAVERMRSVNLTIARYVISPVMLLTMVVIGSVTWLVGKLFSSEQTYHAALVVAAWSYMPHVLGAVLAGVQGLLMDPAALNSQLAISLSPARFLDVESANPVLYQLLGRFDLITIWVTILLGIGVHVTGKVGKGRATAIAIIVWVIGGLPAIRQALLIS